MLKINGGGPQGGSEAPRQTADVRTVRPGDSVMGIRGTVNELPGPLDGTSPALRNEAPGTC